MLHLPSISVGLTTSRWNTLARGHGDGSALLIGTTYAMREAFGSTAHGAVRTMSRAQAKKRVWGESLMQDMERRGIVIRAASKSGVAEEAGFACKDLAMVVDVLHRAGHLCRSRPRRWQRVKVFLDNCC